MIKWYWLSTKKMTFSADVEDDIIVETAPIAGKFVGQPIGNLIRWLKKQGGFKMKEYRIFKIGVVGSRSRNTEEDKDKIRKALVYLLGQGKQLHLVSGGCSKGADKFAEELAEELKLGISIHYPDVKPGCERWEYAQACYARNTLIAEECDVLLAVWDGVSGGTKDTIDKVEDLGKLAMIL